MKRKMIAPIVIAVILLLYFVSFLNLCFWSAGIPLAVKIIGCLIPVALAGVSIYVLIERIKEIRSGEEDDLSKY